MSADATFGAIDGSAVYAALLLFIAFYPVVSSIMWSTTAATYFFRREFRKPSQPLPMTETPSVSILLPSFNEEGSVEETVEACLAQDYPDFEVVVVDDGSTDGTLERLLPFAPDPRLRVVSKERNEGKAMAINDALLCLRGEIVVILDADAAPAPDVLRFLVPHFEAPRVAAVTGNPRVRNRDTLLEKLQTIEFTSIVSILRRAQRIWGRILTVSGVVAAFRKSALFDVGLFSPDMATEDIDMTWKLQQRFYDVRYEPGALVWMRVPHTLAGLWGQRRRWSLGLAQVLRRHAGTVLTWKRRRMWPVFLEASLSVLWAYAFVVLALFWVVSYSFGHAPIGASPIPNWWGMVIASLSLIQLGTGVMLDRRYERPVTGYFPVAVLYPIAYWILMAVITVVSTPAGLLRRPHAQPTRWRTARPAQLEERIPSPVGSSLAT